MSEPAVNYRCTQCGRGYPLAAGRCVKCKSWNTIIPIIEALSGSGQPTRLDKVPRAEEDKIATGVPELDHALDGGWPRASCLVLGGQPGIGKSTLLLQAAAEFPPAFGRVLYVSSEEAPSKIGSRSDRLKIQIAKQENVTILNESDAERILAVATKEKAALVIIDSVQTTAFAPDAPGTLVAAVNLAARFFKMAHTVGCVVVLVCHVTKDGDLAGPKKLEHYVDVVAEFDADRRTDWRTLVAYKNRSGATPRMGVFKMTSEGLRSVTNPAEEMIATIDPSASGWALGVQTEDDKSWIVQAQCMLGDLKVITSEDEEETILAGKLYCSGCAPTRVRQILAVLERRCGVDVNGRDVYVNVVGGKDRADPGLDLAVAAAILSAKLDVAFWKDAVLVGELGLLGEVVKPSGFENRCLLADRYGFDVATPATLKELVDEVQETE
jgi:DNA repair protein RadA/Sms